MEFRKKLEEIDARELKVEELRTLQVNLGNLCNLGCSHCHVQAGPEGKNIMTRQVMKRILKFLSGHFDLCLDITGGCPEMNPDFKFLIESALPLVSKIMVRTNLTVFLEPGFEWIPSWYKGAKVVLIGSLPCYTEDIVDIQRGKDTFQKSIRSIGILNEHGYGLDDNLELDLVYNPGGDFLPGSQQQLEADYKKHLSEEYDLYFTRLFTITNTPIGRFRDWLTANGKLENYMQLLVDSFNPQAANEIMCRSLLSVDYLGRIYNCDFNQALELPVEKTGGGFLTIDDLDKALAGEIKIVTGSHCFCCCAGAGSSCTGGLVK